LTIDKSHATIANSRSVFLLRHLLRHCAEHDFDIYFSTQHSTFSIARITTMSRQKQDLLQGTLDMLILQTLALEPMHGWGISQRIQQISRDVLRVNQGSLYPALHRLEQAGWIDSEWDASENNRQAKYYRLTRTGRRQLAEERENWARMTDAVTRILQTQE
jgi:PadR family transcriptional regulator PadR